MSENINYPDIYKRRPLIIIRKGSYSLWFKRNWFLLALISFAFSGICLSILLLFEPCEEKIEIYYTNSSYIVNETFYENKTIVKNITNYENITFIDNVTIYENVSSFDTFNMTYNVTHNITYDVNRNISYNITQNITYNVSYEMLHNITYNITQNITYNISYDLIQNITYNITQNITYNNTYNNTLNITTYLNKTINTTEYYNYSEQIPVDVMVSLDSSYSVNNEQWKDENQAARALLVSLRNELNSSMKAGLSVWANEGVIRKNLSDFPNTSYIHNYNASRLPYCSHVKGPYSTYAQSLSKNYCSNMFKYDSNQIWGITGVYTYYAQALLNCVNGFNNKSQEDSFKLCIIITDGVISEDTIKQCESNVLVETNL